MSVSLRLSTDRVAWPILLCITCFGVWTRRRAGRASVEGPRQCPSLRYACLRGGLLVRWCWGLGASHAACRDGVSRSPVLARAAGSKPVGRATRVFPVKIEKRTAAFALLFPTKTYFIECRWPLRWRVILLRGGGGRIWDESPETLVPWASEASQEIGTFSKSAARGEVPRPSMPFSGPLPQRGVWTGERNMKGRL